ncbi:MAG: hypothetical protein MZU79_06045 [Anaerotruncus sp.]|nr:hypothetical protein [Anaerotruncus sp.]
MDIEPIAHLYKNQVFQIGRAPGRHPGDHRPRPVPGHLQRPGHGRGVVLPDALQGARPPALRLGEQGRHRPRSARVMGLARGPGQGGVPGLREQVPDDRTSQAFPSVAAVDGIMKGSARYDLHPRHRLRRSRHRHLSLRVRPERRLHGYRRPEDPRPRAGQGPDLRAGLAGSPYQEHRRGPASSFTTDIAAAVSAALDRDLPGRPHPAGEDGSGRPPARPRRRGRHRPAHGGLQGHRQQGHRPHRHGPQRSRRSSGPGSPATASHSTSTSSRIPEFLREGTAIRDFMHPDRIVIGGDNEKSREEDPPRHLQRPLPHRHRRSSSRRSRPPSSSSTPPTPCLATRIAFINEIANLCDRVGADVHDIAKAVGMDGRVGKYFLHPGPGFGGVVSPRIPKP